MKNNIWDTLQEVEEVKVSFKQTLRNINNIQSRYKMVSALKRKAAKRQESFEEEIQAAITDTKIHNPIKKNKIRLVKKKRVKKIMKRPLVKPQTISFSENVLEIEPAFVCLQTNCVYEVHKTTTHLVTQKPFGPLIQRLYRSANRRVRKEGDLEHGQDPNQNLEVCPEFENYYCSCSSCCVECR
ncbi:uncharacterized protein LOC108027735 [Drosophila biarmipes]|uniref:uncharacterized protein LOC108027735 n=1 Tax=Drosophila biarmipes TaxID=125945 RepID=UPI0007E6BC1E|nr:uncharacterized protein LOC108027735 [Drosophila biarmipes]